MRKAIVLAMLAAFAAGCAASGPPQDVPMAQADLLPANFRAMVAAKVRETFFDPYSIRDASISASIPGTSFSGPVQTVCVRANAKNRLGGYTGIKDTSMTFRAGQITVTDSEYASITCSGAAYEPFPEIEAGYKPPTGAAAPKR